MLQDKKILPLNFDDNCVYCFLQSSQIPPVQVFFAALVSVSLPLTTVMVFETALMAVMRLDVSIIV